MSFGFSVGDFLSAISLANQIRKKFISAPSQFNNLSAEYVAPPEKKETVLMI
jgi:hypothetical protein